MKQWLAFVFMSMIWGAGLAWTTVAVREISPYTLVLIRLWLASLSMALVLLATRTRLPLDWRLWARLTVVGVFNMALPFLLESWAQQHIPSSLAGVLSTPAPLFVVLFAWLVLPDEPVTAQRVTGLVIGLGGVLLLVAQDFRLSDLLNASFLGQLAMIGATCSYAIAAVFIRRALLDVSATALTAGTLLSAAAVMTVLAPFAGSRLSWPVAPLTWVAIAWLGLLGATVAYLLYYWVLSTWGPTRTAQVTYLIPVFTVLIGVAILGEPLTVRLVVGMALVMLSLLVVNWPSTRRLLRERIGDA